MTLVYEKDNSIEFRYGKSNISSNMVYQSINTDLKGPPIGLVKDIDTSLYIISGVPSAPIMKLYNESSTEIDAYIGVPLPNSVYRFTPKKMTGLTDLLNIKVNICYDAVLQNLNIHTEIGENVEMSLYDYLGRYLNKYKIANQDTQIDVSHLHTGMYISTYNINGKILSYKFVKL